MADEQGVYIVGELLTVVPNKWWDGRNAEHTDYELKLLVGTQSVTVSYRTAQSAAQAVPTETKPRSVVRVKVVPLIVQSKNGTFIKYVGDIAA